MRIGKPWAILLGLVLVLSLGANLFVAGFTWERWRSGTLGPGGPPSLLAGMMGELPPEVRGELRRRFFEERGRYRETFEALRAKRREIGETIRAERLDVDRLRAQMLEMRQLSNALQERAQEATIDAVRNLPPEARAAVGERRGGGGWGGWGGHGGWR
jgi:uncharacterized membrane protein